MIIQLLQIIIIRDTLIIQIFLFQNDLTVSITIEQFLFAVDQGIAFLFQHERYLQVIGIIKLQTLILQISLDTVLA